MEIVVNHLTRMQPGYICVAGYESDALQHVRPVLGRRLKRSLLRGEGGAFDVGYMVDLGEIRDVGSRPELEDREFDEHAISTMCRLPERHFWHDLTTLASSDLKAAFGDALDRQGKGFAVSVGNGDASLACFAPEDTSTLQVSQWDSVRCRFEVEDGMVDLSVTDLRLFESDQTTIRRELVDEVDRRLSAGAEVVLALGLTRAWRKPGDSEERHWLQVNNVFLADDPYLVSGEAKD